MSRRSGATEGRPLSQSAAAMAPRMALVIQGTAAVVMTGMYVYKIIVTYVVRYRYILLFYIRFLSYLRLIPCPLLVDLLPCTGNPLLQTRDESSHMKKVATLDLKTGMRLPQEAVVIRVFHLPRRMLLPQP